MVRIRIRHVGGLFGEVGADYGAPAAFLADELIPALEAQTIRVAAPSQPRFYRLSVTGGIEPGPVRIESIRVENGEVVLNYG